MSNVQKLLNALTVDEAQQEILHNLYEHVGERVGDLLLNTDYNNPGFKVYDIVDVAVNETLEDFRGWAEFQVVEELMVEKLDEVVAFLKDGYGSPKKIFDSYREIVG